MLRRSTTQMLVTGEENTTRLLPLAASRVSSENESFLPRYTQSSRLRPLVTVRILTRYILREVITYALLGGVLFTFVLFMRYLLTLMELAVRGSASIGDVARVPCLCVRICLPSPSRWRC